MARETPEQAYERTRRWLDASEDPKQTPKPAAATQPPSPQDTCTCIGEREEAPPEPNPDCPVHGADPSPQAEVQDCEVEHLVLEVELPAMYVSDIENLREFKQEGESESDFLLNSIGEPSVVSLTTEISGEKEGSVVTIWGQVRGASLRPAGRGYGDGPHLTDEQLEQAASVRLTEAAEAIRRHDG
jgi:hypothetical protein